MNNIILFGGASYEHEISIVSAIAIKKIIRSSPIFIFLSPDHNFYLIASEQMNASHFANGDYKKSPKLTITHGGFSKKGFFSSDLISGVVISMIHGADGEDGKVASLLDFFGIKYIGPRVEASVLSFNKHYTKFLASSANVKTISYEVIKRGDKPTTPYPFIIKPLRLGSSIGVSVVREEKDLDYAIDVGFEFDSELLIEPFIADVKEYNLAGCRVGDKWKLSIIEEPQKKELLDFDQKYLDFARTEQANRASLSENLTNGIIESFKRIYNTGFDGAIIRCDFFIIDDEIYLNEINPIPGSLANYLFDSFADLIRSLSNAQKSYKKIEVRYDYIHSIKSAKGKL